MTGMITVEEARRILMAHVRQTAMEFVPLGDAWGRVLASDAFAQDDHPRFDMSAVDGYAVGDGQGPWRVGGALQAGQSLGRAVSAGECVRIFTGAEVPQGTWAVVMQEHGRAEGGAFRLEGAQVRQGANIRRKGESFMRGELLLTKGSRMDPASVGLLLSSGLLEVPVARGPAVGVVRTGGEFIEEGKPAPGRIHSSNEWMLIAAAREAGCDVEGAAYPAADERGEIRDALMQAIALNDAVISTGGVSVGDHDLVRDVLVELGASIHFHGVRQKPGKPMLFATLRGRPVFALPGNPRAVLVCWYAYVLPYLRAMQGHADPWQRTERLPLAHAVALKGERSEFRAALIRGGRVQLLPDEGSHMLATLVRADALATLPAEARDLPEGALVEVQWIARA